MKALNELQDHFWRSYLGTLMAAQRPCNPFVEASYAGNRDTTDALLELYLSGKKRAGSSVVEDFLAAGDALPNVGNYWILLDSCDRPRCILRTEQIEINKFQDVPLEVAIAEGEGDLSLDYWRKSHEQFYTPFLAKWGLRSIEDANVITEYFSIVFSPSLSL